MKKLVTVLSVLMAGAWGHADELSDLRKEVDALKREVAELRSLVQGDGQPRVEPVVDRKAGIKAKYEEDMKTYNQEQLREIETLYQTANKEWRSPVAKAALKDLIAKYPRANRTGCAVLYMGQMSEGDEKETYLKQAIKDFGDCFYGNGVQVGAYARFHLAYYYQKLGKEKDAKALFDEIKNDYPDAIDHKGRKLTTLLPK